MKINWCLPYSVYWKPRIIISPRGPDKFSLLSHLFLGLNNFFNASEHNKHPFYFVLGMKCTGFIFPWSMLEDLLFGLWVQSHSYSIFAHAGGEITCTVMFHPSNQVWFTGKKKRRIVWKNNKPQIWVALFGFFENFQLDNIKRAILFL